jgi:uncharacterized protein with HEPN domain
MAATSNPRARLLHILDEIDGVSAAIAGMNYREYRDSYVAIRVVERALEIISEATRALPDQLLDRYPEVEWARIRGIGNFLRHEYHRLDTNILWDIATSKLSPMRQIIVRMLADLGDQ